MWIEGCFIEADMIFELEELDGDGAESSTNAPAQALPLLEQTAARPARHRKVKSLSSAGLPSSFSSLRPLSLPGPSQIRPPRSPHGIDASSQNVMMSLPKQTMLDKQKRLMSGKQTLAQVPEEELDPRDAVILRLVAADTPSHRGAWRPDSEAWKSLTQPRGSADVSEDEEDEGLAVGPSGQSSGDDSAELLDDGECCIVDPLREVLMSTFFLFFFMQITGLCRGQYPYPSPPSASRSGL